MGVIVARSVGPSQFGVFALFWTIVTFTLSGTWALGLAPLQSMLPNTRRYELGSLLVALASVIGGLSMVGAIVGIGIVIRTTAAANTLGALAALIAVFSVVFQDFTRRWFLATERPGLALASDGLRHVTAIVSLLAFANSSLPTCIAILASAAALGCIPLVFEFHVRARGTKVRAYIQQLFKMGRWLASSVVLQSVSSSTPVYALSIESGVAAAGGYRAIFNLLSPIISLTEALETFLPLRSRQAMLGGGIVALRQTLWEWWWPLQLLCTSLGIGMWLFGPAVLKLVFGSAYLGYVVMLPALAAALNLQFASYILHVALRALDRAQDIPRADLASTAVLILLFSLFPLGRNVILAAIFVALAQAIKVGVWGFHARALVTAK